MLTSLVFSAAHNPSLNSDVTATINGTLVTASVQLTENQSLVATFTTTGDHVDVGGVMQQSGVTSNNFLGPVSYEVVAADGTTTDYVVAVTAPAGQQAYLKASNPNAGDQFGVSVALSSDGSTLAIGAPNEASHGTGINGAQQSDNSDAGAGAVYVFTRASDMTWSQQAYIKASNTDAGDKFGAAVALSSTGNTLAVGATGESSAFSSNPNDNSCSDSGAVYVFTRTTGTWSQQAYVKAPGPYVNNAFGASVALFGDSVALAVGSTGEPSGIAGMQTDQSAPGAGAVFVYTFASMWNLQGYLKASTIREAESFGASVVFSGDGKTLAVSATNENSAATGVNGNQADTSATGAGAVYVFTVASNIWTQQAYIKASNTGAEDGFGTSVALSNTGNTLAVGATGEASHATGIDGDQTDDSESNAGAVYVFNRTSGTWLQQAYVKPSNTAGQDLFGGGVTLAGDGNTLAVGATGESGNATGINASPAGNASGSGAVYVFTRVQTTWSQQAYVKASNTDAGDGFGASVALPLNGNMLVVGASGESSNATGINGDQTNNAASGAGAVYIFE